METEARIADALRCTCEAADVDFKSLLDLSRPGNWLELVKDVVAFANSGGGTILIGVNDDGTPSSVDVSHILELDPADLGNKLYKYTGSHFNDFHIVECCKGESTICAFSIGPARIPLVFTNVGSYEVSPGKQKTAFGVGTVYFRHGAKSEPGTYDDLRASLEREVETLRRSWLDGIAKVVEAPAGARIVVVEPADGNGSSHDPLQVRVTDDPTAPAYYAIPIDSTHPYRQKEVVREVNVRLANRRTVTSFDIQCVRRIHSIERNVTFCYTQKYASPRYSPAFVDWIIGQYEANNSFFEEARHEYDKLKAVKEPSAPYKHAVS